ncbi:MAG: hypothetical protein KJ043_21435, partial [Anaerolineae bacterium]|nr:hypothetical protein [Anaerolineae bacterium]
MKTRFLMISTLFLMIFSSLSGQSTLFSPDSDPQFFADNAPYTATFTELALNRPLGFLFYDLTTDELLAGVNITQQLPVVSAIKGPVLIYFLNFVPSEIWGILPVEYWNVGRDDVPEEFIGVWDNHYDILNDVYRMIVYSDNFSTGDVLLY